MRFDEQISGQRSEAAKTVRYEHAILPRASFDYCAQFRLYVKARSSPELHNSTVGVLREVWEGSFLVGFGDFVMVRSYKMDSFEPAEAQGIPAAEKGKFAHCRIIRKISRDISQTKLRAIYAKNLWII